MVSKEVLVQYIDLREEQKEAIESIGFEIERY